jgi:predicted secreted Zn-dependent protease
MKTIIAIIAIAVAMPAAAATYNGKKCKLKWDKAAQTAEGECFGITKSEHIFIINTVPAAAAPAAAQTDPVVDDKSKSK